jgi:thiol:disulfide interchange protein DsbD
VATLLVAGAGLALGVRAAARPPVTAETADEFWSPWTPDQLASLRAEGKPVFVNFTAAWCISCQVNERLVFSTDDVRADFAAHGVVPLKADWTNKNEEIARTLASFGRQGVPLYVYYPGRAGAEPRVLPPVVTRDMLVETFTEGSR